VLQKVEWAQQQLQYYQREGLSSEARQLEQMLQAADAELREMDSIEHFRTDAQRAPVVESTDRGISSSAILRNPEACSIYEGARTWRAPVIAHPRLSEPRNPFAIPVKVGRRDPVSRHRLSRLTKSELIEQLLEIQNAYATVRAAWLELNGRLLSRGSKTDRHGHVPRKP